MDNRAQPLLESLRRASARERALARLSGVLLALALTASLSAGAIWLLGDGRWISLPPLLPLFIVVGTSILAAAGMLLAWRYASSRRNAIELARSVESERALRRGALSGLLEIEAAPALRDRAVARLSGSLAGRTLAPERARRDRRTLAAALIVVVMAAAGFTWSGARHREAVAVLLHPVNAARGELLSPLHVTTATATIPRGTPLVIHVRADARRSVRVHLRAAGAGWQTRAQRVSDGLAEVRLDSIAAATMVYASDARSVSDTLMIRTVERPFVHDLTLEAVYPAGIGRAPEPLPLAGQLLLPQGTRIRIRGRASTALTRAELYDAVRLTTLGIAGASFAGEFTPVADGIARWRLVAATGEEIDPPPALHVSLVTDAPPEVAIVSPAADTVVSGERPVRVVVRAADDHELRSVVLRVRAAGGERRVPLVVPPAGGSAEAMIDVSALSPGASAVLQADAREGLGRARIVSSAPRVIRVMTAAEQRDAARRAADSAASAARSVATTQRQIEQQTLETAQSRGDRQRPGESDAAAAAGHALASRARALVDEQRTLAVRADSLAAATRSLEARLDRAGALDAGLAARLAEVRSLLQRALTPELAARLRDAESAARANEEEPLRRAMIDIAREQRRAREQLERVVRMLRRAAIEGALETLRAEAAELAQSPGADARERAGRLSRDIGGVVSQLEQEGARAGLPPARAAQNHAAAGARSPGSGAGRGSAPAAMDTTARLLAEARAAQIGEWKAELAADIDAAVQELVQLSAAEEALAARAARPSEDWRPEQSALEESVAAVADRVARAARSSTLISSRSDGLVRAAREQVGRVSARAFPSRDATQTAALMRDAAASLARAAASLVRDRDRTNSARSASGFTELLEELQRLAQQQGAVNAAASGLPLDLLNGGAGARETARALARQQRAIARTLEDLGEADGGGRAQPLAAEANRIADALERALVDGATLQRQERLYHRLLEGGRLLTGDSGEDDERREAMTARQGGSEVSEVSPMAAFSRRHRVPGWNELRSLSPAERQMIVEYFERLNDGR